MEIVDTMASKPVIDTQPRRERRAYSAQFKSQIIHACHQPGASIAAIAQANDVNSNVLHRWLREHEREGRHAAPTFLPVTVADAIVPTEPAEQASIPTSPAHPASAPKELATTEIRVECVRGHSRVTILWPLSAAADCGTWIKDWLS